jgi:hypothetical protein
MWTIMVSFSASSVNFKKTLEIGLTWANADNEPGYELSEVT